MGFSGVLINEIFYSLQGETSHSGLPYIFIRLTGCNLRCVYCDTAYAFKEGRRFTVDEVLTEIAPFKTKRVLITGGEPLIQRGTLELVKALNARSYNVSIETHGEHPISEYQNLARMVMDIKTPGSKMHRGGYLLNLPYLKKGDEVKFVIAEPDDYLFMKNLLIQNKIPIGVEVLVSPATPAAKAAKMSGQFQGMDPRVLADLILKDQLEVRFQSQLHKWIWGVDQRAV